MAGFIVIDRKIRDWKWWGVANAMALWLHILVNANWKDGFFLGEPIPRGSFVTSLPKLSDETGMSESTIRRWLKRFEDDGQIEQKVTNKYRVIKVLNYSAYQDIPDDRVNSQVTGQVNSQMTGQVNSQVNSQVTPNRTKITIEQSNKGTNSNSSRMKRPTLDEVQQYISENHYAVNASEFMDYYESNGWKVGRNPMKDWKATVRKWHSNEQKRLNERNKKGELPF